MPPREGFKMETENQWNLQSLFFFFFPCVWNCQQQRFEENRDLIKSTLGKLQGDPLPHHYTRKVTEMLFTRAKGTYSQTSDPGDKRRRWRGAGGGWGRPRKELPTSETLHLQKS